jgi:iron complex outermembrane recepter protein
MQIMSKNRMPSSRFRPAGRRRVGLAGAALALALELIISAPAVLADPASPPPQSLDAQAGQTQTGEPVAGLSEIIVTAQRREEPMQSIPASITAVTAVTLEQADITSAADIGKLVPATMIQETVGTATVFIRGIGSNQLSFGDSPSNAIYIDGVYQTRVSPVMLQLNSVDRIEVLEGPQGTLFGRNSESGLVQIVTRTPEVGSSPHVEADVGYANYRTVDTNLYVSSGLGSNVAGDLAVLYKKQQDGFGYNSFLQTDVDRRRDFAARSKWVFEPTDGTKFIATGYYAQSAGDDSLFGYYSGGGAPPRAYPLGSDNLNPPSNPYDRLSGEPEYINSTYFGGSLRASQELPFADLVSLSSIARIHEDTVDDADFSPVNFLLDQNMAYDHVFTQELQLLSKSQSAIQWVTGLYYLDESYGYSSQNLSGDSVLPIPGAAVLGPAGGVTSSYALYGQTTFPIMDRLSLTLGGRYSIDHLRGFGLVDADIPGAGIINVQPFSVGEQTSKKPLWKETLEYKIEDDVLVYLTNSRGTKAGAFNLVTFDPTPIQPETLDDYEAGFKSEFFNRRLRVNGALFYYDVKNPQVFETSALGTPVLQNAGSARVKGAELKVEGAVTSDLTLRGAVTGLDATYTDYTNAPFYYPNLNPPYGNLPAVPGDATGNRLSRAPKISGNVGAQYRIRTTLGEFDLSTDYSYTGTYYWDPDNFVKQPAYGVLDARISYRMGDTGLRVSVWGTNLTNKLYYLAENQFANIMGSEGFPAPPRQYGVTVGFKY